ncbi:bifunctional diaminohydroxyphosphoribosylaminopyrimidine deaminase/5-amino-6-(5-phosphoribosylamino)uracil reductase RibD [Acidovorax sp. SUPP2539]|uniref:bifunctional diaminohydroxyphosphoribosylaminopyrimidine deaminase/5-amino-6-(5-phosphoribosylamino)uracil reductase RibD n=1 Tax=Acidovorax sp. SUPP2539 TaxID=2920878 RepID=UPI0023DE211A|nr:bifunctional diaminohydroxyphosphoribosylaminopyrimidine deaminase/5-amino-6-(5-phosphoribosylamino)uracil reductase RibD [Acidovorax sp. SUPP2539]GKS90413.1 bifunctional diaminohydroxyphosphoribosylaminopyrimidine deaminase/5-amino-6-(5-phosphoribosylamino)uracil reductase RibD [Acidovorax sp. SUPP2539]
MNKLAEPNFMGRALELAQQGLFRTSPNPRVGCVIVDASGTVLGEGSTQPAGQAHAEIMALRDARERGLSVEGATAYVTLEPCSHHGRTGPCCDALADAGLSKVFASITDPNPMVAGRGVSKLRERGVEVDVGLEAQASRELNLGFFSRMIRRRPWVRMKAAASLDGLTALHGGESQWITSPLARSDGHAWRARACAVLTGIGTVLADDPRLDVREVETPRQPDLILLDSQLRVPLHAAIFKAERRVFIYTAIQNPEKEALLASLGVTVLHLPNAEGHIDLAALMLDLGRLQMNEVHVEAGSQLNGALLQAGLVDEVLLYLAPKLLGPGLGIAHRTALSRLSDGTDMTFQSVDMVGPDLRVVARLSGHADF